MPRKICLVTPGHLATNPRLVKEADALHEAGYNVEVIAARFVQLADEADREFDERPWPVRRTAFGPLASLPRYVAQTIRRRGAQALWRAAGGPMRLAEQAFHPAVPSLVRLARGVRADLYIAHNLAALPAAGRAARHYAARVGFDAEDFHLGELPDDREHAPARRLVRTIEARYLPECTHLTAASPGIARAYAAAYGIAEPRTVLNVFPLAESPREQEAPSIEPGPGLYWFSQTVGPGRGIETAVRAIGIAKSRPHLYLRGTPVPGYVEALRALARKVGAPNRVHVLPPLPPGQLVRDAARFHVGLAAEGVHVINRQIALTNKIFTYALAGIPTVASATPAQAEIAAEMPGAVHLYGVAESEELARAVDGLLCDPVALVRARQAAWELAHERFNWDVEKREFLAGVAKCFEA